MEKNNKLMENNSRKAKEIQDLQAKLENVDNADLKKLNKENNHLKNQLERVDVVLLKMDQKVLSLKEENESLKKVIDKIGQDDKTGAPAINQMNDQINQIKIKLKNVIDSQQNEIQNLKNSKDKSEKELRDANIKMSDLQKELNRLKENP